MSSLIQADARRFPREALPTMYDLPSEEIGDPGMPDEFHAHQAVLLNETFRPPAVSPDRVFSAIDMNLYYDVGHTNWYKRPDWFAAVGVPRLYEGWDSRLSYVAWQEEKPPLIVVELLSPGTEKEDLGETLRDTARPPMKWEVYERILQVPYYAVFSREADELRIFQLSKGRYIEVEGHGGRFWIPEAQLGLGLWLGRYAAMERLWLRWFDAQGNPIPTFAEMVEQERTRAEQERAKAEQERAKAEQERAKAEQERAKAEQERARAEREQREKEDAFRQLDQERQRAARLEEMLRQLGQDPDKL